MLNIIVRDINGKEIFSGMPLTAALNSDVLVPADDLTVTVPFDKSLSQRAFAIEAYSEGKQIFYGQLDEITDCVNSKAAVTKLIARTLAAALLDNEAEPLTYVNPAAGLIFSRHLQPYGIKGYDGGELPLYDTFRINKGMTHWQVLRNFCAGRYSSFPRITGDGYALLEGIKSEGETVVFSNSDSGIKYTSLKKILWRCKLISEVRLKLRENGMYDSRILNENKDCLGVERVRFVNALSDASSVTTADKIIEQGNRNSLTLTLKCVGCHIGMIGKKAVVKDETLGEISGLVVDNIKYRLESTGETTTVILKKGE